MFWVNISCPLRGIAIVISCRKSSQGHFYPDGIHLLNPSSPFHNILLSEPSAHCSHSLCLPLRRSGINEGQTSEMPNAKSRFDGREDVGFGTFSSHKDPFRRLSFKLREWVSSNPLHSSVTSHPPDETKDVDSTATSLQQRGSESAPLDEAVMDIIFVHGIRGGPFVTWRKGTFKPVSQTAIQTMEYSDCWPSSWLTDDLPNARLLR